MPTHKFIGAAQPIAQVDEVTIGGVAAGASWTLQLNQAAATYTAIASDTVESVVQGLITAIAAAGREFQLLVATASTDGTKVVLTSAVAGEPYGTPTIALAGGATGSVASITVASGPNFWAAENFDSGSLPVAGDTVVFEHSSVDLLYDLDQNGLLSPVTIVRDASYEGRVGLLAQNPLGFPEYRTRFLKISCDSLTAGLGTGNNSDRFFMDFDGYDGPDIRIHDTGASNTETQSLCLHNFTNGKLNLDSGGVEFGGYAGQVCGLDRMDVAGGTAIARDGVSHNAINMGGDSFVSVEENITSLKMTGGDFEAIGTVNATQVTHNGGNINWHGGAIDTYTLDGDAAVLSAEEDFASPLVISTMTASRGQINDPQWRISVTTLQFGSAAFSSA